MRGSHSALGGVARKLGVQLHHEGGRPQPRGGLIDSLIRAVHGSTSVGLLELGRLWGVEELGDELPYSSGVVFLEEVAAV